MSVNIFKNGILSKIAGTVGDAVPLINNFLTNQEGKGAADANTVYVLNNKIEELNSSLVNLVKLKNQSVTFTNGYATFSHESIKTTSIIIVQTVSGDGRGATAIIVDVNEVVNHGSVALKAYDAYSNKNHSGNQYLNILIYN